jgi:glycosyltransferase involved in cell wall biosynthesis
MIPTHIKVSLFNTFEKGGGAAIACQRLRKALQQKVDYRLITLSPKGPVDRWGNLFRLALEKFFTRIHLRNKNNLFAFDTNTQGIHIYTNDAVQKADLLHLHWINQGLLSLPELEKIFSQHKPIVWTLHDMWPFTGGCHYSQGCERYEESCGQCPFLKGNSHTDLSHHILEKKTKLFSIQKPYVVTCSNWLADCARQSHLMKDCNIRVIPNPIDTDIFKPSDQTSLRKKLHLPLDKTLILFSSARLDDPRKGISYLVNSLNILHQKHPALKDSVELVLMGNVKNTLPDIPYTIHTTGFIHGDENLAAYYAACNVFALPSIEDNLPNTVMEALACGTAAVAFNNGGLSDLIEHQKTGYLAVYKDEKDFAQGVYFLIQQHPALSARCRQKTVEEFSEGVVAEKYFSLYQKIIH